jgi:hypothetical protein
MPLAGSAAPRIPTCKLCRRSMFADHRRTVVRSDRTEMRVYACDCGARKTLLFKPAAKPKRGASSAKRSRAG